MIDLKSEQAAAELALALEWGYVDLACVIDWADSTIVSSKTPDLRLFDLSLAGSPLDALSVLRDISINVDKWKTLSRFLRRFETVSIMSPQEASKLAERLYKYTAFEDTPDQFRVFSSHWDKIDLAIDGVFQDVENCVQCFLDDIHHAALPTRY